MVSWDEMDDFLRTVSLVHWQTEDTLKCYYQLKNTFSCFDKDLDKINLAPSFFSTAVEAMRYQIIVGTAKLFDYSGTAGIPRILNQGEQNPTYRDSLKCFITKRQTEYKQFEREIRLLRIERDQFYAHLDKRFLLNGGQEATFLWDDFEKMLIWALDTLSEILQICGVYVPSIPITLDLQNLLDKIQFNVDAQSSI